MVGSWSTSSGSVTFYRNDFSTLGRCTIYEPSSDSLSGGRRGKTPDLSSVFLRIYRNPGKCHNGTESSRVTITFFGQLSWRQEYISSYVYSWWRSWPPRRCWDCPRFGLIRFKWFGLDSVPLWSTPSSDLFHSDQIWWRWRRWRSTRGRLLSSCNLRFLKLWEALSVVDGETFCGDRRLLAYSVITVVACWTGCVDGRHTWSHLRSSATWKDGLCDGGKGGAGGREKMGSFRGTQGPAFVFCLCVLDCSVEFACVRACMDGVCVCVSVSICVSVYMCVLYVC